MFSDEQLKTLNDYEGPIEEPQGSLAVIAYLHKKPLREIVMEEASRKWNNPDMPYPLKELMQTLQTLPFLFGEEVERLSKEQENPTLKEIIKLASSNGAIKASILEGMMRELFPNISPKISYYTAKSDIESFIDNLELDDKKVVVEKIIPKIRKRRMGECREKLDEVRAAKRQKETK